MEELIIYIRETEIPLEIFSQLFYKKILLQNRLQQDDSFVFNTV